MKPQYAKQIKAALHWLGQAGILRAQEVSLAADSSVEPWGSAEDSCEKTGQAGWAQAAPAQSPGAGSNLGSAAHQLLDLGEATKPQPQLEIAMSNSQALFQIR